MISSESCVCGTFSRVAAAFKYQAVARNSSGELLKNQEISLRFQIRKDSILGQIVYTETHVVTTNEFGLFTVEIGRGDVNYGEFNIINWGNMLIQALAIGLSTLLTGLVIYLIGFIGRIILGLMKQMLNLKITTDPNRKEETKTTVIISAVDISDK